MLSRRSNECREIRSPTRARVAAVSAVLYNAQQNRTDSNTVAGRSLHNQSVVSLDMKFTAQLTRNPLYPLDSNMDRRTPRQWQMHGVLDNLFAAHSVEYQHPEESGDGS